MQPINQVNEKIATAMRLALQEAALFRGATDPNPPVGAVALDKHYNVLAVAAHERAGLGHAEKNVIDACIGKGLVNAVHALVVTLEPCNHQGKTPPCTQAILATPCKQVFIGCKDSNPEVAGGGIAALESQGLQVQAGVLADECLELLRPFFSYQLRQKPYVTIKQAFTADGSMIPPRGLKTFTSQTSLVQAHLLRKRAGAIITGSGTILADKPLFTVRLVADHSRQKPRYLLLFDRRERLPTSKLSAALRDNFTIYRPSSIEESLQFLHHEGVLEVLVEAGPELSSAFLASNLWDELYTIKQGNPDQIEVKRNHVYWNH